MINILLVEDDEVLNDFIFFNLKNDDYNIMRAYDVFQARKFFMYHKVDVILTDIIMPGETGIEFLESLDKRVPTIVMTALQDRASLDACYKLGVIDYLNKPIDKEILKFKVNNIIEMFVKPNLDEAIVLNENEKEVYVNGAALSFTKTEYEVFALLYNNQPRIYSKEDLIDLVWYENDSMSNKIVDVNIFNIRKKLGEYGQNVKTKRNVGYYYED